MMQLKTQQKDDTNYIVLCNNDMEMKKKNENEENEI